MKKNIKYQQFISNGIDHVIIMPIYGTVAFARKEELNLPMRIDRESHEKEGHFDNRVDSQHVKLCRKINHLPYYQTWLKTVMAKPTIVNHDYTN